MATEIVTSISSLRLRQEFHEETKCSSYRHGGKYKTNVDCERKWYQCLYHAFTNIFLKTESEIGKLFPEKKTRRKLQEKILDQNFQLVRI